jgi:signal transduction histidine kinase
MNRIIDKLIIFLCCVSALLLTSFTSAHVVAFLMSIAFASLYEIIGGRLRLIAPLLFLALVVCIPAFVVFLPVIIYDLFREKQLFFRVIGFVPLVVAFPFEPLVIGGYSALLAVAAGVLSARTTRIERERIEHLSLRDALREMSLTLESKNRELQTAQDYEVHLATLNERGRIAREIHDNVGHLLTRAIMQTEALQVVHADNECVRRDFAEVGATLHEAMNTVRTSVHDLYDDALDVRMQAENALAGCGIPQVRLVYEADDLPAAIGYCFMAIIHEALSNTVRHSDASAVEVDVKEYPGLFQLVIQDNGSRQPSTVDAGMGLQTMEDRVRTLGGVFRTEYRQGFRVFVSVPRMAENPAGANNQKDMTHARQTERLD